MGLVGKVLDGNGEAMVVQPCEDVGGWGLVCFSDEEVSGVGKVVSQGVGGSLDGVDPQW